jgi:hypothetical protein
MIHWRSAWHDWRVLTAVFLCVAMIASLDKYARGERDVDGQRVTQYNNYVIFQNAATHLSAGEDMYVPWPREQVDLYKYSPTFAVAMWPLAQLPEVVGLCLWNVGGALILLWGLRTLPFSSQATAGMAWIVLKDLLTNLQNSQSNGLVAALMIITIACWERHQLIAAATALALSFYIKIFGVAVAMLWLVYPHKTRSASTIIGVTALLALAPLLVTSPELLGDQYASWGRMLGEDHAASLGDSVMGLLEAFFGLSGHKRWTLLIGGLLLVAPLVRVKSYSDAQFRFGLLASVLLWVVLFNHKAESPTFVIAASGVAVWFCSRPATRTNVALLVSVLVFTSFSSSDLCPEWLQDQWFAPYHLKAVPCLAVWLKIQAELWTSSAPSTAVAPTEEKRPALRMAA